ncbi:MAG TPA: nuclear transport factor 2 family protein [Mycobacteriales bacterium]|jgi:carboxymethylenebutenolidase
MEPAEMERLWDAHTAGEFAAHDVDATMATMVAEPYVMHLPTLIGAQGGRRVRAFYTETFIPEVPADFVVESVSRTVGTERIVDEMIVTMTHDRKVSWILPGVPATGRRIEVGVVGVIGFADGLIDHEHLWWDQASVLVQVGLLDPDGLPVHGAEITEKLRSLTEG